LSGLAFRFLDPRLHDVADRNHADQLAVAPDREMAEAALGHHRHQFGDGILRRTADDIARHDGGNRLLEDRGTVARNGAHDVALRKDADHLAAGVADDQGTDPFLGEKLRGIGQ
jgi:hypothetical protein